MKKKQAIALLLATVLAGTGTVPYAFVSTVYAGQGNAPDAPTNLKTEMLNEAYGIDTKDPAFSWVVNDKHDNVSSVGCCTRLLYCTGNFWYYADRCRI